MTSPVRSVSVRMSADVGGYIRGLRDARGATSDLAREVERTGAIAEQKAGEVAKAARQQELAHERQLQAGERLGAGMLIVGAGIAAGIGLATRAAIQWESAWAGVAKTVDGSEEQMAALEADLRELATTLPATHGEIAAVAEAAGQLGVATEDIASFTRTMIDLGESTNLTADEAATAIAQLMNVMGTAPNQVGRLGSALVELGNNGASTERQIIMMAQRIAGAGAVVGASEADVLALANALASAGIEVEAGGSAISKVLVNIASAAAEGGDAVEDFARVAGVSADEFTQHFAADPIAALDMFVQGLGRMNAAGENVFGTLDQLGLSEIRTRDALLRLSSSGDLLTQSLEDGSRAWQENIALTEEAERRYGTAEARLQVAQNQINDFAIEMGEVFVPALAGAAEGVSSLVGFLAGLPDPMQQAIGLIAAATAGLALFGGATLIGISRLAQYRQSLVDLGLQSTVASTSTARLARGMRSTMMWVGRAAGALVAFQIAGAAASAAFGSDFAPKMDAFTEGVARFGREGEIAGEVARVLGEDFGDLEEALRVLEPTGVGPAIGNAIKAGTEWAFQLDNVQGSLGRSKEQLDAFDQALASLVQSGRQEEAADAWERLAALADENGVSIERLKELFPAYAAALETAAEQTDETGSEMESMGDAAAEAAAQVDELREAFDRLFGIQMDIDRATIEYKRGLRELKAAIDEGSTSLDLNTEAGQDNRDMVLDQIDNIKDLRDANIDNGMAIDDANEKYQSQLTSLEELLAEMGFSEDKIHDIIEAYRQIPDEVDTEFGVNAAESQAEVETYHDAIDRLPSDDSTEFRQPGLRAGSAAIDEYNAHVEAVPGRVQTRVFTPGMSAARTAFRQFAAEINNLPTHRTINIHTAYSYSGQQPAGGQARVNRWGGIYANADGGIYTAQSGLLRRANIFPPRAPAMFAFAEPQTGGEAFVPRLGDRRRSMSILDTAAGWYGAHVVGGDGSMSEAVQLGAAQRWTGRPMAVSSPAGTDPEVDERGLARLIAQQVGRAIDGARLVIDDRGNGRMVAVRADHYRRGG